MFLNACPPRDASTLAAWPMSVLLRWSSMPVGATRATADQIQHRRSSNGEFSRYAECHGASAAAQQTTPKCLATPCSSTRFWASVHGVARLANLRLRQKPNLLAFLSVLNVDRAIPRKLHPTRNPSFPTVRACSSSFHKIRLAEKSSFSDSAEHVTPGFFNLQFYRSGAFKLPADSGTFKPLCLQGEMDSV